MNFKKISLTVPMMLYALLSFSQYFVLGQDATSYESALAKAEAFCEAELERGYDFTIHHTERVIELADIVDANTGNAGYYLHGVPETKDYIQEHATAKVAIIIIDDCAGYTHDAIPWLADLAKDFTGEAVNNIGRHSHHVAGIAAGQSSSVNLGIAAPLVEKRMATVVPLKALTNAGSGTYAWVANAVYYAKQIIPSLRMRGYTEFVVNLSLGGSSDSELVSRALRELKEAGVTIVAAAGNTGRSPVQFPGRDVSTIGTGALVIRGTDVDPANYTSKGPQVVLSAAGSGIYSCQPNNQYAVFNGTSMAAPQVAGVAANLMSCEEDLEPAIIEQRLIEGSIDVRPDGKDESSGWGYPFLPYVLGVDDNPDDPGDGGPGEPEDPDFTSILTYEMKNAKMYYKTVTQSQFVYMDVEDLRINVSGLGNTDRVYDTNDTWSQDYFQRTRLVIPDDPQWGHCLTAYWTGQFYEYTSRNQGIGAQVSWLEGIDHDGQRCLQDVFDRANTGITSYVNEDGVTVMQAQTEYGTVTAFYNPDGYKKCRRLKRWLGRC